jgi:hypothetical protein
MDKGADKDIGKALSRSRARATNSILIYLIVSLMVSQLFLVVSFFELNEDYQRLKVEKDLYVMRTREATFKEAELAELYDSLEKEHGSLVSDYEELSKKYMVVEREALRPPYILVSGREALLVWKASDGSVRKWSVPIDAYRAQLLLDKPKRYLTVKDSRGVKHRFYDFRIFVNPEPFEEFAKELYGISGSRETFIYDVWSLVTQLSDYTPEIGETPRWPLETLVEGGGDCEDVTILIISILMASGEVDEVGMLYMDVNHPTDFHEANHVIVYVRVGENETIVDGTAPVMNPFGDDVDGFYYPL